ncbi:MAG: hypothetical protein R2860_15615 [Desulfobacterales bacterium]
MTFEMVSEWKFTRSQPMNVESYMDAFVGLHSIIRTDAVKNDPDALVEVSLDEKGTHRFPQGLPAYIGRLISKRQSTKVQI